MFRERAQFKPLKGSRRIFLIDHLERANEQSANSLLKILEEPPEHLLIFATTENLYDLLPTIRSRSFVLQMSRLSDQEMQDFARGRKLPDAEARIALAEGSPGVAVSIDLAEYRERRSLMTAALACGAGLIPLPPGFSDRNSLTAVNQRSWNCILRSLTACWRTCYR